MTRVYLILLLGIMLCFQCARSEERLKLEKTTILGNRELPRVTFVVPWRDDPSAIPEWKPSPMAHPLAAPLDRKLYQRQIDYLKQLKRIKADDGAQ